MVEHRSQFRIVKMCQVLGVSRSGYGKHLNKLLSASRQRKLELTERVTYYFQDHHGRYGAPRITDCLWDENKKVSEKTIGRIMQEQGLKACSVKKFKVTTTDSNHKLEVAENQLNQQFTATEPNQVWMADITYIWTRQGRLYLASIMDLFSRKIVGWSLQSRMTTALVLEALDQAIAIQKPGTGLLHHSDRGSQYASDTYQARLATHEMVCSMSRKGNCYDNAVIESYHSTLKRELIYQEKFASREIAKQEIYWYLEFYYNRKRKHSSLGMKSPVQFENAYYARQNQQ
jgi:putative transposase